MSAWIELMRGCGWLLWNRICADYLRSRDLRKATSLIHVRVTEECSGLVFDASIVG